LTSNQLPEMHSTSIASAVMPATTRPAVSSSKDLCSCLTQRQNGEGEWGAMALPLAGSTRSAPVPPAVP
jgi:hypothetical protein